MEVERMIIERSTGQTVSAFLQARLRDPLGMGFGGSWSIDSEASGFEKMEAGLNARAIDFAKLGRLYLQNGKWNVKQLIPALWVADSVRPHPETQNDGYYSDAFGQILFHDLQGSYQNMWVQLPTRRR